jgi:hypothetical protein
VLSPKPEDRYRIFSSNPNPSTIDLRNYQPIWVLDRGILVVEATMCVKFRSFSSTGIPEDGFGLRLAKGVISFDLEQPFSPGLSYLLWWRSRWVRERSSLCEGRRGGYWLRRKRSCGVEASDACVG